MAFLADEKAATAVEFGLVAAPFIALLVAIMQTFLVIFGQQLLQTVVTQSSRSILANQASGMTQAQFGTLVCNQVRIIFNCSNRMIDVQTYSSFAAGNTGMPTLNFNGQGQVTNTWQFNPGNAGDIVVVRVVYLWPVFFGSLGFNWANQANGTREIIASAAFQNEP